MKLEEAIKIIKQNFPKRCERVNGILKGGFDDKESQIAAKDGAFGSHIMERFTRVN